MRASNGIKDPTVPAITKALRREIFMAVDFKRLCVVA